MKRFYLLSLFLLACAGPRIYAKPGATVDDFESDKAFCMAQAQAATTYQQNPFIAVSQQRDILDLCLRGKGWREQGQAATPAFRSKPDAVDDTRI